MGIISDLFANDRDGRLRRHTFRVISTIGYLMVLGVALFLTGLVWRMFNGSEVEIFGIRVANPEPPSRTIEPQSGPITPLPPITTTTSAPGPPPPAGPLQLAPLITNWIPVQGDFEACVQMAIEVLNKAQFANVQRITAGVQGQMRREGVVIVHSVIRCLGVNGLSIAFVISSSHNAGANADAIDAVMRELSLKTGNVPVDRLAGTAAALSLNYYSLETRFESQEACTGFARKALDERKASIQSSHPGAIFATIGGVRTTVLCLKDAANVHAVLSTHGFWRDEAMRVREGLVRELLTMKR